MSKIDIEPNGRFSAALKSAIEASDMSLAELAEKVESSYEHLRKLVAGRAYPSLHLLRILATTLKADRDKWAELVEADRFYKDYKYLPKFMQQSPELEPFETVIPKLSPASRDSLLKMANVLLKQENARRG
jgi:transcriptional regulator with XRE-family HTH domain